MDFRPNSLSVTANESIKMTRKVSFRDETDNTQNIADIHYVPSYKKINYEESRTSCLKCELF